MKKEYDFSEAERGKLYRPNTKLNIPVYLESDVQVFVTCYLSKLHNCIFSDFKTGLDRGFISAGSDYIRRGPFSQNQPQSAEYYRLAGAGRAGKDIQTRFELNGKIIDQGIISDTQRFKQYPLSGVLRPSEVWFLIFQKRSNL